ncbi:GMP synthase - Glutamine amidotransferase [Devosia lucknowensis]|uniref:GMP synthase - Glutamine amidotransferase n=1 Tax=Devosia lucknowensis TaxID=1096929 RepID=A0A1Y6FHA4_9HYPH|nr:glutamine amidotransferase [Devosia lucknowensis]SMQ72941.1 GMP synthase - Glutamine amidotransferase [Devosia lucknowensis]
MKITLIEVGRVPDALQDRFSPYRDMFGRMFASSGRDFELDVIDVLGGQALPDPAGLEAIAITGSSAGVYEDHAWLPPLRSFIRDAYAAATPMVGICFGHQVMADALGGDVRKSEKGWGLGRHTYDVVSRPAFLADIPASVNVVCSHQDQVITPPAEADVILASEFTPNAGLYYRNGAALSFQPHPEFLDDYGSALIELRKGRAGDDVLETARQTMSKPSDSDLLVKSIAAFFLDGDRGPGSGR